MMRSVFLISFISLFNIINNTSAEAPDAHSWTYKNDGPAKWHTTNPVCGGSLQSPINLDSDTATYNQKLGDLEFTEKTDVPGAANVYTVTNNGHSVVVEFPEERWKLKLNDGTFGTYEVKQMHFHWGLDNTKGSEHTLDEKRYAMETHIVCFQRDMYTDFESAYKNPGGLAVLGIFHEVDDSVESGKTLIGVIGDFETKLDELVTKDSEQTIAGFEFNNFVSKLNLTNYFRYPGSLTTPPCTENVVWTVLNTPVKITTKQLTKFRMLQDASDAKIADNYRPVQPLNTENSLWDRPLYRSWGTEARPGNAATSLQYSCLLVLPIIAQFTFKCLHSE